MEKFKLSKIYLYLIVVILIIFNSRVNSQWHSVYSNSVRYKIAQYPMSNFYIRINDFFSNPSNKSFKTLFSNGTTENLIFNMYNGYFICSNENESWCTWWSGNYGWTPNTGDRYYTLGMYGYSFYPYYDATNFLLIMNTYSGLAKILAPAYYPPYLNYWNLVWSNNGSHSIGEVFPINIYIFAPGNFNSLEWREGNSTGKELLCTHPDPDDGDAYIIRFDYNWQTNEASWSTIWYNVYGMLGPWMLTYTDRMVVGDFDGDYKDEVLIYNSGYGPYSTYKRAMLLKFQNGNWVALWDNNKSGWIGNYQITPGDYSYTLYSGCFCTIGPCLGLRDKLLIINKTTGRVVLQTFNFNGQWDLTYNNNSNPNYIGNNLWQIRNTDNFYAGAFGMNLNHELDNIFAINYQEGWAKILSYFNYSSGCPWITVYNSDTTGHLLDNNILHRSEFAEYAGSDIGDLYKLNIIPYAIDNKFSIQIVETEHDYNYFDRIKLYAIDHPVGTKIGVTENNDIVMYDDDGVISTDNANQNGVVNITPFFQYNSQGRKIITGNEGDSIYAHYDSSSQLKSIKSNLKISSNLRDVIMPDSMAVLGEIGQSDRIIYPSPAKDYAGDVTIYTTERSYVKKFARRENNSTVFIPFSGITDDPVDHIDVNWYRDYSAAYFTVVPIAYTGFDVQAIPLTEATHSLTGDILSQLNNLDMYYAELDSNGVITLKFDNIGNPQEGYIRDYVFETIGRYLAGSLAPFNKSMGDNLINRLNIPRNFKLHQNYPNPFNPYTKITYELPINVNVTIKIYDIVGHEVETLLNNRLETAGIHEVEWNASQFASGVYIYTIEAGTFKDSRKMVLLK